MDAWFNEESPDPEAIEVVVFAICFIRSEMTLKKSSLKVLATDTRGGVCASAIFLSMYDIMQELDESINTDNQIKQCSNPEIDVFAIVNRLRKDTDKMVEDFATYKILFQCINHYGLSRQLLMLMKPRHDTMETFEPDATTISRLSNDGHHKYVNIEEMSEYL